MSVTIKDIARKIGINFSSVSRALNNKPGVSSSTRALVIKTANEMGYYPNIHARGLVRKETRTIGVLIPEIINPLFSELATSIIETANENSYDIFLCISNWNPKKEREYLQTLKEKRVDGIIMKSCDDSLEKLSDSFSIPIVGYETWPKEQKHSFVSTDNIKGGFLGVQHLLECGYAKVAYIGGVTYSSTYNERMTGYRRAFEQRGISFESSLIYSGEYHMNSGYSLMKELFSAHRNVDAVFAGNDVMALGVLRYLNEQGIRPGTDVGVVGFDNIQIASLPQIGLTTINQPIFSIGRIITRLLLEEIENKAMHIHLPPQKILLEPDLMPRTTTCARPGAVHDTGQRENRSEMMVQ